MVTPSVVDPDPYWIYTKGVRINDINSPLRDSTDQKVLLYFLLVLKKDFFKEKTVFIKNYF